jgi:nicotinamide-nucleotide amidase
MKVEVLAVGTELLLGQIVNSNAAEIGVRLADAGLDHHHQTVVGDNLGRIADAIRLATSRSDALIITGGIGPTQDDMTREALSEATSTALVFDERYADQLRAFWAARGRDMPESNLRQAYRPAGAEMIPNPKGTAPGLRMHVGNTWVFVLPGVPQEMLPMVDNDVIPFLQSVSGEERSVVVSRVLRTWGESESKIGELLGDLYDASLNPTVAFLASAGEIKVRLTAKAATEGDARGLIEPVEAEVRARLGTRVFATDADSVEAQLIRELVARKWTIGTAESATGGMVAARITAIPGASAAFRGSIVAYDAETKTTLLGVPAEVISRHGLVSEEVAAAMADGAASRLGVDVAIAVTGAAGPDEHDRSAAGTMVVAVHTPEGTQARTLKMPGDRERVRTYTTTSALHLARMAVTGLAWGR